jgi:cell pole-organizing protein PopZ
MGDLSAEPSMEEILSSIKRIIQEEGEGPTRGRRAGRPTPAPPPMVDAQDEDEEVLELSNPMPPHAPSAEPTYDEPAAADGDEPEPFPDYPEPEPVMPQSTAQSRPTPAVEALLSRETAEASRSALDNLSRMLVKPEPGSDGSLEGLVREMLRPMLREWLDTNLPPMVERMVEGEIARITGAPR